MANELLDLELEVLHETKEGDKDDGAILVVNLKFQKVWLPKSLVEFEPTGKHRLGMHMVTVPRWLAEDRELV